MTILQRTRMVLIISMGGVLAVGAAAVALLGASVMPWMAAVVVLVCGGIGFALVSLVRSAKDTAVLTAFADTLAGGNTAASLPRDVANATPLGAAVQSLADAFLREAGMKQGIVEGLPVPFLLVDTKERALFTNQECMEMLQIDESPQSQYGRTLAEIFYNDSSRKTAVGQSIENGKVFRNLEVTITGHKGGTRHVLANVYPLYDSNKVCLGGFCLYLDMTELKQREEEICRHNELVARSASRATDISNGLASAAEELSAQVEQSSVTSREQMDRTREVSASMEQMNATVLEVAKSAGEAATLAGTAREKAQEGARVVGESSRLIERVYSDAMQLKDDMNVLGEQAQSIGAVVSVINDIADQTNLLALNAAIEAARAGEAGRGFAVVADEVRKLAEKTMQATKEVTSAIGSIQQSTEKSIVSSQNTATAINENKMLAATSGKVLSEIVELVEQTADHVRDIAAAAEEQSSASDEIAAATEQITHSAAENSHAMQESSGAVSELARMAAELRVIITDMKDEAPQECEVES